MDSNRIPWQFVPHEREALEVRCFMFEARRYGMLSEKVPKVPRFSLRSFFPNRKNWSDIDEDDLMADIIELPSPAPSTFHALRKVPYTVKTEPITPVKEPYVSVHASRSSPRSSLY